jgi:hypothetical protein
MTKTVVGSTIFVDVDGISDKIPAKVDTGADRSSIDVSNLYVDSENRLHYTLFHKGSPFYTGKEIVVDVSRISVVKNSTGHRQVRYRAAISLRIEGRRISVDCNLSNRRNNKFPILIGRRTLGGKFLVDVSKHAVIMPRNTNGQYNAEMKKDPHAFFNKYHTEREGDV